MEALRDAWAPLSVYSPTHMVDRYIPRDVSTLDHGQFDKMLAFLTRLDIGDPFALFAQRARACYRAIYFEPDYTTAAIEAQLASEFLLDAILLVIAWEEGIDPTAAAAWFNETLTRRIRHRYSVRLGGSWETRNRRTSIGRWAKLTRDLRNKVVHAGYYPTENEAAGAQLGIDILEAFVKQRLLKNRYKYPKTTLLLLGFPGLERMGRLTRRYRLLADRLAQEPPWLQSYGRWVSAFERERERRFA